ncbi:hypothetical protein K438DRAFT_2015650 [Mycena galopus ATCC 62051]|nr:hypothetical protein K438DRAFT_2015650 [Mycena galopus ATCC 62051]
MSGFTELYSNGVFPSIHWFRRHLIRLIIGGNGILPLHDHTPPLLPSSILRICRVDFDSVALSSLNRHATAALADSGDVEGVVRHLRPVPDRQVEAHVDVWKHHFISCEQAVQAVQQVQLELQQSTKPLPHTHIQFAHCYKDQAGWSSALARFHRGGGTLYDLEFLTDATGRRVAAFGFYAGFAGAAAGALAFSSQQKGENLGHLKAFDNEDAMVATVKQSLVGSGTSIKALVIGALGRCGSGAVDLFRKIGLREDNILKWDLDETAKGGPFDEILDVDIFVNCIYLNAQIPSFITRDQIIAAGPQRKLSVVVDVSCDTTNPFNPIPIYSINTTFAKPTVTVNVGPHNPALSVVSIDHLPALVPREASERFSMDLLPSLLKFPNKQTAPVWSNAEKLFKEKVAAAVVIEGLV